MELPLRRHKFLFFTTPSNPRLNYMNTYNTLTLDENQQNAFDMIKANRDKNFFIQGQAGTGKSTLINYLRENLEREVAVVAPTGIAAQLIGGTTIHQMFHLGSHPYFPKNVVENYQKHDEVVSLIHTLIIDEASMLRADVFDTIDSLCKKAKNNNKIFGGIQIVLVGDLYQLPPVYNYRDDKAGEAQQYMYNTYKFPEPFFFDAECYSKGEFTKMVLSTVHRQEADRNFLNCLRAISSGNADNNKRDVEAAIDELNKRYKSGIVDGDDIPIVTSTNNRAIIINNEKLDKIQ